MSAMSAASHANPSRASAQSLSADRGVRLADHIAAKLARADGLEDRIAALADAVQGRVAFSTSLGIEDQVILHAIAATGASVAVFTLDTGRHFPETLETLEASERRYGLGIRVLAPWPPELAAAWGRKQIFLNALLGGITLGALYFLVAAGFTLIFGLMRIVNLAHGSLFLIGGYLGYEIATACPGMTGDDELLLQPKEYYRRTERMPAYQALVERLHSERKQHLAKFGVESRAIVDAVG